MDEGEFGSKANTDLLMTAERVLPCRKAKEHDAFFFEEVCNVKKEIFLATGSNVLYYIVNKYEVVTFGLTFWLICEKEIFADESALLMAFCKESLCFVDPTLADVYSCHITTHFSKWKQIASFAATYFQNAGIC